jgi:cell division protein ZipA
MELSVREWTIIVGVLLILAVFLDGYRRVRNERSNRIRVSLSKQVFQQQPEPDDEPVVNTVNPELPNGGARVIAKQRSQNLHLSQNLQLGESVPVLIEPVSIPDLPQEQVAEPAVVEEIDEFPEEIIAAEPEIADLEIADPEVGDDLFEEELVEPSSQHARRIEPQLGEPQAVELEPEQKPARAANSRSRANRNHAVEQSYIDEMVRDSEHREPQEQPEAQEVLVVNVLSKDKNGFNGPDLLQILLACDLRFGKMQIFHRYENAHGRGPIQFSLANLVEPGTFDLDAIDTLTTPGVSFFMTLPGPQQSITAFNYMIETAQVLVRNLNAELRDDAHSVMTAQTIEHCRQRIRDFERKQLTLQL